MVDNLVIMANTFAKMFYGGSVIDKIGGFSFVILVVLLILLFVSFLFYIEGLLEENEKKEKLSLKFVILFGVATDILTIVYVLLPPKSAVYSWFAGDLIKLVFKIFS